MTILYLDLDGVFADMESAVHRYTGASYDPKTSWAKIEKVPHFFRQLYPLRGALKFFDIIKHGSTLPIEFLTASPWETGELHTTIPDKKWWVDRYLCPTTKVNVVKSWKDKGLFAQPGCILVDDSLRNIEDWVACGGTGVHHTSNWDTIQDLRMLGVLR